ncbi:MAG: hypothetical protein HZA50_14420 [Planctomycetes bacterium]|nr:hypothetical protein [Planctomycetota bacterium]
MTPKFGRLIALLCAAMLAGFAAINADQPATAPAATTPATNEWKLPLEKDTYWETLSVSADCRWVICGGWIPKPGSKNKVAWLLDTKSGKSMNLLESVYGDLKEGERFVDPRSMELKFSSDGKYFAASIGVEIIGELQIIKCYLYLFSLENMKHIKVKESEGYIFLRWCKDKLYVACPQDKLKPMMIYDPVQDKTVEQKISYVIVEEDPNGNFLLVACDPDDPTNSITAIQDASKVWLSILSTDGKLIRKLVMAAEVSSQPILSPNGKYVAYEYRAKTATATAEKKVMIHSTDGQDKWEITAPGKLLKITDDMQLITKDVDKNNQGKQIDVVRVVDSKGNKTTIAEDIRVAGVGGDKLFVVFYNALNTIKAIPLPKKP